MIGIKEIASFVPSTAKDNLELAKQFGKSKDFVINRLGAYILPVMEPGMETSDLATKALLNLLEKARINKEEIDCLVVCTQNPDGRGLPHTSAIVQEKAGLSRKIAAFDISLGCSGYVYALNIIKGFLEVSGMQTGILITADPYSKIIDEKDANTAMLFGDAATATLITGNAPVYLLGGCMYETDGTGASSLINNDGILYMNGRSVFNFVATAAVRQIIDLLNIENLSKDEIDCFVLHQGSKYIVETIASKLGIMNKTICSIEKTGNTISSSIPLILEDEIKNTSNISMLISGFGVGFSIGSMIIQRTNNSMKGRRNES